MEGNSRSDLGQYGKWLRAEMGRKGDRSSPKFGFSLSVSTKSFEPSGVKHNDLGYMMDTVALVTQGTEESPKKIQANSNEGPTNFFAWEPTYTEMEMAATATA